MANEQNLIPFNKRTEKERREISRKGGRTKTPNRKIAAQLRELKKKGLTDENAKRLYKVMTDPEISALHILTYIESIKGMANKPYEKGKVAELLLNWQKTHFGEKQKIESLNVNVNMDMVKFQELQKQYDETDKPLKSIRGNVAKK